MALVFRKRLPAIPSKKVRRTLVPADFLADTVAGEELTASVTFMDYNKQTITYSFDVVAVDAAAAQTVLTTKILPALAETAAGIKLQGLQMLSYSLTIHQEIGDDNAYPKNPQPAYGHQREMHGVLTFPVNGELVEHKFPNPTDMVLEPTDKRYLSFVAQPLIDYIALFTGATPSLQIRGFKPGAPQKGFMRHTESRVQTESVKIG